jgi:hypothetical protein
MPERHRFPWCDDHDDPANAGERYPKEPLTTGELHALDGPTTAPSGAVLIAELRR